MFYLPRSSTQQPFRLFFCCGVSLASKKWETLAAINNYHDWGWFIQPRKIVILGMVSLNWLDHAFFLVYLGLLYPQLPSGNLT